MLPSVLIVDDYPDTVSLVARVLQYSGIDSCVATDGVTALQISQTAAPDLILLDVSMPVMDGREVLRRLKEDPRTREIPVLFHTAGQWPHSDSEAQSMGANGLIRKGSDGPDRIISQIQAALMRNKRAD